MAINQRYTRGGGKWLTENKATCFPTFGKRRFLRPGETADDFKEVTDAQKAALEKLRDEWTRPPQSFIDQWNEACRVCIESSSPFFFIIGTYNEDTGYFELNGLTDISYVQAIKIYDQYLTGGSLVECRTNIPSQSMCVASIMLTNTSKIEVFVGLPRKRSPFNYLQNSSIREIYNITISSFVHYQFQGTSKLTTIENIVITATGTMWLHQSPALSLKSIENIVNASPNGNNIVLHPLTYNKLTDELIDLAAEKQITFTTTE